MTALDRSSMITRLCSSMLHQNHGTSPRLNERKTIISNGCSRKRYYNTNHNMLTIILMTFMIFVSNMIVVIGGRKRYNGHPQSRSIRVINESGYRFDLYWIHVQTRELGESNTKDEGVMFGSETHITSYIGHEFTIKELPGKISGVCRSSGTKDICKSINITVNANEEQWFTITKDFEDVIVSDNKSRAMEKAKETLDDCNEMIESKNNNTGMTAVQRVDLLTECLQQKILNKMDETNQEIEFQANVRKSMSKRLKQYICNINNHITLPLTLRKSKTTASVRNVSWTYEPSVNEKKKMKIPTNKITSEIRILFETDYSSIRLVKNFTTKEECSHVIQSIKESNKLPSNKENLEKKVEDVYNITSSLLKKDSIAKEFVTRVNLLLSASIGLTGNYYSSFKNQNAPLMEMKMHYPQKEQKKEQNDTTTSSADCELSTDGTCVTSSTASSDVASTSDGFNESDDDNNFHVREVNIDPNTIANVIIFCSGPKYDKKKQQSGMLFFPKAGVKILPKDMMYNALVLIHEDSKMLLDTGRKRDPDPFIDEYITCPVIEDNDDVENIENKLDVNTTSVNDDMHENELITIEDQI